MKNLVRLLFIIGIFVANYSLLPMVHLGLAVALLLNYFYRREESLYVAIGVGLLADLFFIRAWGVSSALALTILIGCAEALKHAFYHNAPDFLNACLTMALLSILMNFSIFLLPLSGAVVKQFGIKLLLDFGTFVLLYVVSKPFLRVRTVLQYEKSISLG